jgi:hypothetical protein
MGTTKVAPKKTTTKVSSAPLPPAARNLITTKIWATAVLKGIGAPVTANNITNMERWMASEEPASSWLTNNDPLNTTKSGTGKIGTMKYATVGDGINATVATLNQSNFAAIKHALRTNAPFPVFQGAVVASPWAAGHYGGQLATKPLQATASGADPTGTLGQTVHVGEGAVSAAGDVVSDAGSITSLIGDITDPSFWKRVGVFFFGVVLVGGGVVLFVVTSKDGKKVESLAPVAAAAG